MCGHARHATPDTFQNDLTDEFSVSLFQNLMRSMSIEQRWQDLATLLALPTPAAPGSAPLSGPADPHHHHLYPQHHHHVNSSLGLVFFVVVVVFCLVFRFCASMIGCLKCLCFRSEYAMYRCVLQYENGKRLFV